MFEFFLANRTAVLSLMRAMPTLTVQQATALVFTIPDDDEIPF